MYGASEIAKMYGISRQTVYNKWNDEKLADYIITVEGKKKLRPEGLQLFGHMMAESKPIDVTVDDDVDVHFTEQKTTTFDSFTSEYISSLKQQIEDLKRDNQYLKEQNMQLTNTMIDRLKLLEAPKEKSFIKRLFGV